MSSAENGSGSLLRQAPIAFFVTVWYDRGQADAAFSESVRAGQGIRKGADGKKRGAETERKYAR